MGRTTNRALSRIAAYGATVFAAIAMIGCSGSAATDLDLYVGMQGDQPVVVDSCGTVQAGYSVDRMGNILCDGKVEITSGDAEHYVALSRLTADAGNEITIALIDGPVTEKLKIIAAPVNATCKSLTATSTAPHIVELTGAEKTSSGEQIAKLALDNGIAEVEIKAKSHGSAEIEIVSGDGKAVAIIEVIVSDGDWILSPPPTASEAPVSPKPSSAPVPMMYPTEKYGYVTGERVAMRTAPGGEAILELQRNTAVVVMGECQGSYLVRLNDVTGYVIADQLAVGIQVAPTPAPAPDIDESVIDDVIDGRGDPFPPIVRE